MFRIPTLAEVIGLFCKSRTVAGATKSISDTVKRLEDVAVHHSDRAGQKRERAEEHRLQAAELTDAAFVHVAEAQKAKAVAKNLSTLLS